MGASVLKMSGKSDVNGDTDSSLSAVAIACQQAFGNVRLVAGSIPEVVVDGDVKRYYNTAVCIHNGVIM